MATKVNCKSDFQFQVDVQVPGADGRLTDPGAGVVTGLKLRLAATPTGNALHATVDNLAATETSQQASTDRRRFVVAVDAALLTAHVLPLGRGTPFYAVWFKAGDLDNRAIQYVVEDREVS
jgi:hypothetical protein